MPERHRGGGERLDRQKRRFGLEREGRRNGAFAECLEGRCGERVRFLARWSGEAERDRQKHIAELVDRRGEIAVGIVVHEAIERLAQIAVIRRRRHSGACGLAQFRRNGLLGLGEQHVEHDDLRARGFEAPHRIGEEMAAQRPAAERVEALVVHHDDSDGRRRRPYAADAEAQIERRGLGAAQGGR